MSTTYPAATPARRRGTGDPFNRPGAPNIGPGPAL